MSFAHQNTIGSADKQLTEIGLLPTDWRVVPLAKLAERIMVGIASAATHAYRDQGVVMFRNQNIRPGILNTDDVLYIDPEYEQTYRNKRLKRGDLLTARTGYPGTTSLVPDGFDGSQSFTTLITRPRADSVHAPYLCLYINSRAGQRYFEQAQIGGGQKNVNAASLKLLPVALPATDGEQRSIAEALADADALLNSLEQLLTKKRQIKQGAMRELLTGKRRLPGFNAPWTPRCMADLFDFSGGLSASRDQLGSVGSCYLHYGDIHLSSKTYIDLDLEYHLMPRLEIDLREVSPTALLRNGDVVFVDASEDDQGVSKHVAIHCQVARPLISGLHTIVARPKSDELVDLYKRYCFQAPSVQAQFRFYAVGTKVSGVSKGNIGKIMLDVPSPSEQAEIAACLVEMDTEIDALESRLTKARALKQAMAQALLTGRIRLVEPTA